LARVHRLCGFDSSSVLTTLVNTLYTELPSGIREMAAYTWREEVGRVGLIVGRTGD